MQMVWVHGAHYVITEYYLFYFVYSSPHVLYTEPSKLSEERPQMNATEQRRLGDHLEQVVRSQER